VTGFAHQPVPSPFEQVAGFLGRGCLIPCSTWKAIFGAFLGYSKRCGYARKRARPNRGDITGSDDIDRRIGESDELDATVSIVRLASLIRSARRALRNGRGFNLRRSLFTRPGGADPRLINPHTSESRYATDAARSAIWPSPNLDPTSVPMMPDAMMPDNHSTTV
jgi:hypothetical protein